MSALSKYSRWWGFVLICVGIIFASFIFVPQVSVLSILPIQFSDNIAEFELLTYYLDKDVLLNNVYLDFVYILFYTILFLLSIKVFELSLGFKRNKWLYIMAVIPGLCDVVENIFFISLLNDPGNEIFFNIYFWAVRIKWITINIFLLITFTIMLYYSLVLVGKLYNLYSRN